MKLKDHPVVLVILVVVFIAVSISTLKSERTRIHNWADENNHKVVSMEQTWLDYGPFFLCNDDQTIYKANLIDLSNERECVYYFRVSWWRLEAEKDE